MKYILTIILLISLGACNNAPTDYVTRDELDEAMSVCNVQQIDLSDYVLKSELEDYATIERIEFIDDRIDMLNSIVTSNSIKLSITINSMKNDIQLLKYQRN